MSKEKDKCPEKLEDNFYSVCEYVCSDYCKEGNKKKYKECIDECLEHW